MSTLPSFETLASLAPQDEVCGAAVQQFTNLILRSDPKDRVSKDGGELRGHGAQERAFAPYGSLAVLRIG
jgi:hypothetical protein